MGKVSKALAKFDNRGGHTSQTNTGTLLLRGIDQAEREKTLPLFKRTSLPLVYMFLAGILLGFFLSAVGDLIPAVSTATSLDVNRHTNPLIVMKEKAEVVPPLPTMSESMPTATQFEKAGAEEQFSPNDLQGLEVVITPPISVSQVLSREEEVNVFLQGWKKAWEQSAGPEGNLGDFYSYYADAFSDGLIDKASWQRDKSRKNIRKAWINVELEQISLLEQSDDSIHVRFFQRYRSSNYSENSNKNLILIREDGKLKILTERG